MDYDELEVSHTTVILPLLVVLVVSLVVRRQRLQPDYSHIPAAGSSLFPFVYIGAFRFLFNVPRILEEGYRRHGDSIFKVADFTRWNIIITGTRLIEELKTIPESEEMSYDNAHSSYGLAVENVQQPSSYLSTKLARNLPVVFSEMRDELVTALADVMRETSSKEEAEHGGHGWASVPAVDVLTEVVSRVCNRAILGSQVCRSAQLTAYNTQCIRSIRPSSAMHALIPEPLCTIAISLWSGIPAQERRLRKVLAPIIKQRREKPHIQAGHDLLSSLVSEPSKPRDIANSLLVLNAQAVPSCSLTLTSAIYRLAAAGHESDGVKSMRQQVEEVLRTDGWTLKALERMTNVDSFLRETLRLDGSNALTMHRTTLAPYTFSDGTFLPAGAHLSLASAPTHLDARIHASPHTFDAQRFASGPPLVAATPDFLAWGLGRGACPGRFFAAVVMKLVFVHMLVYYDVRLVEGDDEVPEIRWLGTRGVPELERRVEFRRTLRRS